MPDPTDPLVTENAQLRTDYHALQQELQKARTQLVAMRTQAVPRAPWHFYLLRFFTNRWMTAAVNFCMLVASLVFITKAWTIHAESPDATYNSWLERHRQHDWSDKRQPAAKQRRHTETSDADADDAQDSN